jgi:hypothetical protein
VAAVVAVGVVGAWLRTRNGNARWRRPLLWSLVIVVVAWAPAVLQEIVHEDNVAPLVRSLLGKGARLGRRNAAGIFGAEFHVPPPWLGGHPHLDPFANTVVPASATYLLIPIALLALAALLAWRDARLRVPLGLTALLFVVGVWSISRVVGTAERYAFYWRAPIAILVVFVAVAAVWYAMGLDHRSGPLRATLVVLSAVVVFSSGAIAVRTAQWGEVSRAEPLARAMLARLRAEQEPRGSVLVRAPDSPLLGLERTVVNELDRAGSTVRVDDGLGFQFGYSRVARPSAVQQIWYVVENGQYLSVVTGEPGARVLWATAALPPAQELELRRLQRRLWSELQRAGRTDLFGVLSSPLLGFNLSGVPGIDTKTVDRVGALDAAARRHALCRCAVVAFDAADAPTLNLPS